MDSEVDEQEEVAEVEEEDQGLYFIDGDWFDNHDLSFTDVVQARMCPGG